MTAALSSSIFLRSLNFATNSCTPSSPVGTRRYLRTNAVTPLALSHFATSTPSLLMESAWKPPPGQMTTAVPLATAGAGAYTVNVGCDTLVTTCVLKIGEQY